MSSLGKKKAMHPSSKRVIGFADPNISIKIQVSGTSRWMISLILFELKDDLGVLL